jgi:hypothetical protein
MSATWELSPADAAPGDEAQLLIFDRDDGRVGRTVCVILGNPVRRISDNNVVHLLDEQDLANAALIRLAHRMREALAELIEWSARLGGWEAPCWDAAQNLLATLHGPPTKP